MFVGLIAFGLFSFVVGGAALAVYNWTQVRRFEQVTKGLEERLRRVEQSGAAAPGATTEPAQAIETPGFEIVTATPEPSAAREPAPDGGVLPRILRVPPGFGQARTDTFDHWV